MRKKKQKKDGLFDPSDFYCSGNLVYSLCKLGNLVSSGVSVKNALCCSLIECLNGNL